MNDIPETGFLRLPQVLSVIPLGKTCWWEGVRSGRFPKPVKLSARCTAWRAEDIRELIRSLSEAESSETDKTTESLTGSKQGYKIGVHAQAASWIMFLNTTSVVPQM